MSDDKIDKLTELVEAGFRSVAEEISTLHEKVDGLQEQVTANTKAISGNTREIARIHDRLDNVEGFRTEIDHGLDRITKLEERVFGHPQTTEFVD